MFYHRNLPHWQPRGRPLFLTFRLFGLAPDRPGRGTPGHEFARRDRWEGRAASGPRWLADPRVAATVRDVFHSAQGDGLCQLHAWVIMPNHIHLLMTPYQSPSRLMQLIKGQSARRANLLLGRTGQPVWQAESYDHWVRCPAEAVRIRRYIERNPVAAGLAARPEDWPWSSAFQGKPAPTQAEACSTNGGWSL